MTEYDWPMVTTPDGDRVPVATVGVQCPYPSCNWKSIIRATATDQTVPLPKHVSQGLMAHINEEHAHIYDRMGLEGVEARDASTD